MNKEQVIEKMNEIIKQFEKEKRSLEIIEKLVMIRRAEINHLEDTVFKAIDVFKDLV